MFAGMEVCAAHAFSHVSVIELQMAISFAFAIAMADCTIDGRSAKCTPLVCEFFSDGFWFAWRRPRLSGPFEVRSAPPLG